MFDTIPNINIAWEKYCIEKVNYHIVSLRFEISIKLTKLLSTQAVCY